MDTVKEYIGDIRAGIIGAIIAEVLHYLLSLVLTPGFFDWSFAVPGFLTGALIGIMSWRLRSVSRGLSTLDGLVKLDSSLLRLLPPLVASGGSDTELRALLRELLRDATEALGPKVNRACILLPDARRERLPVWAHYQLPNESVARNQFYIGPDRQIMRGSAGATFVDKQLRIVKIKGNGASRVEEEFTERDGKMVPANKTYIDFEQRPHLPYSSFVNVPIFGRKGRLLGVVCFDSTDPDTFFSKGARELLRQIATRISSALMIRDDVPKTARKRSTRENDAWEAYVQAFDQLKTKNTTENTTNDQFSN